LKAAWRVGRLTVTMARVVRRPDRHVDSDLVGRPHPEALSPADLLHVLRRSHQTLVALHGHEVLTGMLLDEDGAPTAAAAALRVLAAERGAAADEPTESSAMRISWFVIRCCSAWFLRASAHRSSSPHHPPRHRRPPAGGEASVRESLRLRIRWVHELTARAAMVLGTELVRRGALATASNVSSLRFDEVAAPIESRPAGP
jgi:rifampicin phosphotransferase